MTEPKPVILLSRQLPETLCAALGQLGELRVAGSNPDDALLAGAAVYLAAGVDPVPAQLIDRFGPELGLIANIATGTDNIDARAAAARGIAMGLSSFASKPVEEVVAANPKTLFQVY